MASIAIPVALAFRRNVSATSRHSIITGDRSHRPLLRFPHRARSSSDDNSTQEQGEDLSVSQAESQVEALEARLKSRRRKRRSDAAAAGSDGRLSDFPTREIKPWDEMSLGEKAYEVYVGDKGVLFWLNKLAYASIFVIAGGWIVFRFVGPALGWYTLDNPPLPPEKLFSG